LLILSFLVIPILWISHLPVSIFHKTEQTENQKRSGKNEKHINQDVREVAKEKYDYFKKQFDELDSKPKKSDGDKDLLKKIKKLVKHWKNKMDNTGENHSQRGKGN